MTGQSWHDIQNSGNFVQPSEVEENVPRREHMTSGTIQRQYPSLYSICGFLITMVAFGCILLLLGSNGDITHDSVFVAFIASLLFILSAHAIFMGLFGSRY